MEDGGALTATRDLEPAQINHLEPIPPNGSSPPRIRRLRRRYLFGAALAVLLVSGGGLVSNLVLSGTYSPQRAVMDYLTAQSHGDVDTMWQNGVFTGGEGSYHVFFTKDALAAMMKDSSNRQVSSPRVTSLRQVDGNTEIATVSVNWYGSNRTIDLRVVKDTSHTHWLFYPSWRVVAPTSTINFTYPSQGGEITIDGIPLADSSGSAIEVISGRHRVVMASTDIVAESAQTANVSLPSDTGSVELSDVLTPAAAQAAADAVRHAFASCDVAKDEGCPNHRYTAPNDGARYFVTAPDGSRVFYTSYIISIVGDPTATMKTVFEAEDGHLTVSGACTTRFTADTRSFDHNGTFSAKLSWNGTGFDPDMTWTC